MPRTKGPVFSVTGYLVWNYFAQCYEIILDDDQTQPVVFRNNGFLMRWRIKQWRKYRITATGHLWGDWDMLVMKVRKVMKPAPKFHNFNCGV